MLDRLNQILDSWESRNRRSHWLSAAAKTVLSFGVAAGTAAAAGGSAEAAIICNCTTRSCSGNCVSCSWYCIDEIRCCSVVYTKHCYPTGSADYYCGGSVQPMC